MFVTAPGDNFESPGGALPTRGQLRPFRRVTIPKMGPDPATLELLRLVRESASPEASAQARDAHRRAAEALFAAHHRRIYGVCLRLTGSAELAADLSQETFTTAWVRLGDYRGEGSFYAWLYGIARFRWMASVARRKEILAGDELLDPADPARGPLAAMRESERDQLLDEVLRAALDPIEQEAVTMRYTLNMSVDEITRTLGLTEASGARGLLQTCRRKLQRELHRRLEELGHGTSLVFGSLVSG